MNLPKTRTRPLMPRNNDAFTLTELITTVALTGTIAAIGTPIYINQTKATCQRAAEAQLSQIMTQAQAFNDEYGVSPKGWTDLNKISSLMTNTGIANGDSFRDISLPNCNYSFSGIQNGSSLEFVAIPPTSKSSQPDSENPQETAENKNGYDVTGCINVSTGASQIHRGDGSNSAQTYELICEQT